MREMSLFPYPAVTEDTENHREKPLKWLYAKTLGFLYVLGALSGEKLGFRDSFMGIDLALKACEIKVFDNPVWGDNVKEEKKSTVRSPSRLRRIRRHPNGVHYGRASL